MMLAAGLGPAGYAFAIALPARARLLQGRAVPRRRVGQARDERRGGHAPLRRPAHGHADHLRHVRASATWRSSASRRSPASSPRTPIIEAAFDKGGTRAGILGTAALIGAGITAFYMTRVMFMTFFGERRWDDDGPPARGAAGDDLADDRARARLRWASARSRSSATGSLNFLGPVTGYTAGRATRCSRRPASRAGAASWSASAIAWAHVRAPPGARPPPRPPGSRSPRARKDLYGDAINESLLMRPGQWLTRLSVYFDNRGVDGLVNTVAATVGGTSGRMRRVADRVRPLLRPVHVRRRGAAGRRAAAGEDLGGGGLMSTFPWLTVIGAIPLVGALVIALTPGRRRRRAARPTGAARRPAGQAAGPGVLAGHAGG